MFLEQLEPWWEGMLAWTDPEGPRRPDLGMFMVREEWGRKLTPSEKMEWLNHDPRFRQSPGAPRHVVAPLITFIYWFIFVGVVRLLYARLFGWLDVSGFQAWFARVMCPGADGRVTYQYDGVWRRLASLVMFRRRMSVLLKDLLDLQEYFREQRPNLMMHRVSKQLAEDSADSGWTGGTSLVRFLRRIQRVERTWRVGSHPVGLDPNSEEAKIVFDWSPPSGYHVDPAVL